MTNKQEIECICKKCLVKEYSDMGVSYNDCGNSSCECHITKESEGWEVTIPQAALEMRIPNPLEGDPVTVRDYLKMRFYAEREKAYQQGHFDGHDQGLTDGMDAGEKVTLDKVKMLVERMKVKPNQFLSTRPNKAGQSEIAHNRALQDLLTALEQKRGENSI